MGPKSAIHSLISTLFIVQALGCATARQSKIEPSVLPATITTSNQKEEVPPVSENTLLLPVTSLQEALLAVRNANPVIKSNAQLVAAHDGLLLQAGAPPNPEILLQTENIGGSYNGASLSENTLLVSQLIERGGKRELRLSAAQAERELARVNAQIANEAVFAELKKAYARARTQQDLVSLARDQVRIATEERSTIKRKQEYGALQLSEVGRATILQKSAEIDLRTAENKLLSAKRELALLWNGQPEEVGTLESEPLVVVPQVSREGISKTLPYLQALLQSEVSRINVESERAKTYQDVRIGAGVRRIQETQDTVFVGEASLPLPILNNNEGSILAAEKEAQATHYKATQLQNELFAKAKNLQNELMLFTQELQTLKTEIIGEAEKNFRSIKEAFVAGRASYLELLDMHRTLTETRKRILEVALSIRETRAELETLILQTPTIL